MTQQYIIGEFTALLADLEPTAQGPIGEAVCSLRREVERSPLGGLPQLTREALELTDLICWRALDLGDIHGFSRCAKTASTLLEFTASANLS